MRLSALNNLAARLAASMRPVEDEFDTRLVDTTDGLVGLSRAERTLKSPIPRAERRHAAHKDRKRYGFWTYRRLPGSLHPFKHAQDMDTAIAKVRDAKVHPLDGVYKNLTEQQIALNELPVYASRGHGGQYRVMARRVGSRALRDRSKYDPGEEAFKHMPASILTPKQLATRQALFLG